MCLPSGFALFSFLSFPPPPPPIFRLSDVNGEDLNVQDILARNIDANSVTLNYLVARNEIDLNVLHDANFFGMVESIGGFVSDLFCSFSDRENCIDASGPVWSFDNFGIFVDGDIDGFDITAGNDLDVTNDLDVVDDADIHGTLTADNLIVASGGIDASADSNFVNIGVLQGAYFNRVNATGDSNFVSLAISGQTFALDFVNLPFNPVLHLHAATKEYVDIAVSGLEFDFFLTDSVSDIATYFDLIDVDSEEVESSNTSIALNAGQDQLIFNYATELNKPEFNTLLSSVYDLHAHFQKSGGASKTVTIYWELWERDIGGTETELFTSENSREVTTTKQGFDTHAVLAEDENIDGNRLVVKIYANVVGGGATTQVIIFQEGTLASHVSLKPPNTALSELFLSRNGRNWMNADLNLGGNTLQNGDVNATGDSNFTSIGVSQGSYLNNLWTTGDANFASLEADNYYSDGNISLRYGDLVSEQNPDGADAIRIKGTDYIDIVIGGMTGLFAVWNVADDTPVFFVDERGDTDIAGDLTVTNTSFLGTVDFGTNTITDGTMTGDWDFTAGDLTTTGEISGGTGTFNGLTNFNANSVLLQDLNVLGTTQIANDLNVTQYFNIDYNGTDVIFTFG